MVKEALISTKVTTEIKKRLESLAHDERRSLSNYVALVLERHVVASSPFEMPVFPAREPSIDKLRTLAKGPRQDPVNPADLRVRKSDFVRKKHKAPP
jgi:hypothetical protein